MGDLLLCTVRGGGAGFHPYCAYGRVGGGRSGQRGREGGREGRTDRQTGSRRYKERKPEVEVGGKSQG